MSVFFNPRCHFALSKRAAEYLLYLLPSRWMFYTESRLQRGGKRRGGEASLCRRQRPCIFDKKKAVSKPPRPRSDFYHFQNTDLILEEDPTRLIKLATRLCSGKTPKAMRSASRHNGVNSAAIYVTRCSYSGCRQTKQTMKLHSRLR